MDICRVCMSSSVTLVDIFSDRPLPDYEISLAEMLNELVDFNVNLHDNLPQKICVSCGLNAQIAFRFQRRFQQSHQLLCMKAMESETNFVCVLSENSSDESVHEEDSEGLLPMINKLESLQMPTKTKLNAIPNAIYISSSSSSSSSDDGNETSENEDVNIMQPEETVSSDEIHQTPLSNHSAQNAQSHGYQLRALTPKSYYKERDRHQKAPINTPLKRRFMRSIVRNFKCDQCRSTFSTQENLDKHMSNHDFIVYNCFQCNAAFGKTTQLEQHALTHVGECPYTCLTCTKNFRCTRDLNKHIYSHSMDRPFQCNICKLSFKTSATLRKHQRIHTEGASAHKCKICQKIYTTKFNLKKHLQLHLYT